MPQRRRRFPDLTGMSDRPINVLVLVPTLDIGGAETDLVRTLPLVDRTRFNIAVLTFYRRGVLADQLDANGIPVFDLRGEERGTEPQEASAMARCARGLRQWPIHWAREVTALPVIRAAGQAFSAAVISSHIARRLCDSEIDVLHAVLPNSYVLGGLGNLLSRRRPLVMSRVSLNWYQRQLPLLRLSERYIFHRGLAVAIGNSRAVLQDLRAEGIPESKLRLVHNGIDAPAYQSKLIDKRAARADLGIEQTALVMSVVANLHPYKGHADLLRALADIAHRLPPSWILLAAGRDVSGNLAVLNDLAAGLGLSTNIRFVGERTDVATILSAADVHVSASHTESLPNNILEAMCAGLPIIATNVGGVSEQLSDGVSGLLVPARAPQKLSAAIETLVNEQELRLRLGAAARDRVARAFPIEPVVAALQDIYRGLIKPRTSSHGAALSPDPCT